MANKIKMNGKEKMNKMEKITELNQTVDLMNSNDYKDRFKAEYYQLLIRYQKLMKMYKNWDNLDFTPTCSKEMYGNQLAVMSEYLEILRGRAVLEKVNLSLSVE